MSRLSAEHLARFDELLDSDDHTLWGQAVELLRALPEAAHRRVLAHRLSSETIPERLSVKDGDLWLLLNLRRAIPEVTHLILGASQVLFDLRAFPNLRTLDARVYRHPFKHPHPTLETLLCDRDTQAPLLESPRLHTLMVSNGILTPDRVRLPRLRHLILNAGLLTDLPLVAPNLESLALMAAKAERIEGPLKALAVYRHGQFPLLRADLPELQLLISGWTATETDLDCARIDAHSRRWDDCPHGLQLPIDLHTLWALALRPELAINLWPTIRLDDVLWAFSGAPSAIPAFIEAVERGHLEPPKLSRLTGWEPDALEAAERLPQASLLLCLKGRFTNQRLQRVAGIRLSKHLLRRLGGAFAAAGPPAFFSRRYWLSLRPETAPYIDEGAREQVAREWRRLDVPSV